MTKTNALVVLLIVITVLGVSYHIQADKNSDLNYKQQVDALQRRLEENERELSRHRELRNAYNRTYDSLVSVINSSNSKLKEKDREIANLKGKYKNVPVDSLSILMDQRASNAKR